jgi:hypothetical protein
MRCYNLLSWMYNAFWVHTQLEKVMVAAIVQLITVTTWHNLVSHIIQARLLLIIHWQRNNN